MDSVVHVLERAICDSFHEVRRVACGITCHIAGQHAASSAAYAKTLLKSLLTCLAHQQAKVRTAALDAISLIVKSNPQSTFEEALAGIQKLSFDRSAPVRSAVLEVCASWLHLQNLDPAPAPRLLPLLFHGVADAIPTVQGSAVQAMEDVPDPLHCAQPLDTWAQEPDFILSLQQLPQPFSQRPSPSSRATVRRYLEQLLPCVLHSMQEWTVDGRQRGVNALLCIMVYAEGALLLQLPQVVKSLASALRDDEEGVALKAVQCARLLGCLVPLPALTQTLAHQAPSASAAVDSWADLAAYAIAPAPAPQVLAVAPAVLDFIERCDAAASDSPSVALACARLLHALVSGFQGASCACPDRLFHALVKLISSSDSDVRAQAHAALSLAAAASSSTVSSYVASMAAPLLQQLVAESSSWTPKCSSLAMFCTLNRELGAGLAAHLPPVVSVLQRVLSDASLEPELRARVMILLKDMCSNPALAASLRTVDRELFSNAALPGCQWRHGRVSAVLRKAAVAAVESALVNGCVSNETALEALLQHLPTWITCMDDDEPEARFTAFKASTAWCAHFNSEAFSYPALRPPLTPFGSRFSAVASALDYETQRKLYPELLKRLDDSNDAIRVEAARAFEQFLRGMAAGFEPGQMEYMVRALCVHLDDGNAAVQDAVQAVMLQVTFFRALSF